jgi:hypothetical protein
MQRRSQHLLLWHHQLRSFSPTTLQCGTCADGGPSNCVNPNTDSNNCGGCNIKCATGQVCNGGTCTTPPPTACTTSPCASSGPNSVQCASQTNTVCSPTEALIVARDISKNNLTGGQLNANSCYSCMLGAGCMDDIAFSTDKGHECADVPSTAATLNGETGIQACLDTVGCIITKACDTSNPPSFCFCGSASGTACLTAGAANGPCFNQEVNGLDIGTYNSSTMTYTEGDPTATQKAYTNVALGSGMANALMGCAFSNCQAQCTP